MGAAAVDHDAVLVVGEEEEVGDGDLPPAGGGLPMVVGEGAGFEGAGVAGDGGFLPREGGDDPLHYRGTSVPLPGDDAVVSESDEDGSEGCCWIEEGEAAEGDGVSLVEDAISSTPSTQMVDGGNGGAEGVEEIEGGGAAAVGEEEGVGAASGGGVVPDGGVGGDVSPTSQLRQQLEDARALLEQLLAARVLAAVTNP